MKIIKLMPIENLVSKNKKYLHSFVELGFSYTIRWTTNEHDNLGEVHLKLTGNHQILKGT